MVEKLKTLYFEEYSETTEYIRPRLCEDGNAHTCFV